MHGAGGTAAAVNPWLAKADAEAAAAEEEARLAKGLPQHIKPKRAT
jgi:hypothetical protein